MKEKKQIKDFISFNENSSKENANMKELIIQALNDAFDVLEKRIPLTKKKTKSISIIDVEPINLLSFMKDNNIPNDAYFDGRDNGYDAFDDILLSWDIDVPTTDEDKLKFKRDKFTTIAFRFVFHLLEDNGYKRVGYYSGKLKQFSDTTVYDMYIEKDFDRLVEYYSLAFVEK